MNSRVRSLSAILVALVLVLLTVGPAAAKADKTYFTCTETWVEDLEPGDESFPDGRYHLRGGVSKYAFEASDPRVDDAVDLITINWNFKWMPEPVYVAGRMWGTFIVTNDGGTWEGTWTGVREENGYSYFHYVGHGGGGYEGLQLRMWGERLDPDPMVPESWTGYVIEPGG
ncbi:MAG: hypothetical protein PVI07_11690 [Anaerolineae bacterium]|jgi:hypothetical protein